MNQQTITINGKLYDARTGMPIGNAPAEPTAKARDFSSSGTIHSHQMHQKPQRSHTLNRQIVKKAAPKSKPVQAPAVASTAVKKSPSISKFAPRPSGTVQRRPVMSDIAPTSHPLVNKAQARMLQKKQPRVITPLQKQQPALAPKPSTVIKQEAVAEAIQKAPSHQQAGQKLHKTPKRQSSRLLSIASATIALLLLGGYFTYLNMPNLSVRVAAAQAGINASYPSYHPDGYRLNGPVAYDQGKVGMKFAANTGSHSFTITQTKTDWDSTAVQENLVKKEWGSDVMQYAEHGLTIYAHDGKAVWVNNGILYRIDGNAPLSGSQIRSIATSM